MKRRSRVVFLSYAHADEEVVARIYEYLRKAGLDPWMDRMKLKPGHEWRDEIDRAVRSCGAFLSLVSRNSLERPGVLRGEMKLALDLRAERLDDGGFLIPVRLERCELPEALRRIQALDWFAADGPERLSQTLTELLPENSLAARLGEVLRSRWRVALVFVVCLLAAVAAYQRPRAQNFYEAFLRTRHDSPVPQLPNQAPQIGVTLWRVTEDNAAAAAGPCGFLRFSRQPLSDPVRTGDRLRLDVQTARPGYVYVISGEIQTGGKAGPARLLFPVGAINGGNNRIEPGNALIIPPATSTCTTLQLLHAGETERMSVLVSDEKLDALPAEEGVYTINPEVLAKLFGAADTEPMLDRGPSTVQARDVTLPDGGIRELGYSSAGPDAVFTFRKADRRIFVATISLTAQAK